MMKSFPDPANLTIPEIKAILAANTDLEPDFLAALSGDPRQGVQELVSAYYRSKDRKARLIAQWREMCRYEQPYWERGAVVCGVDEAGRGPLAGPVVAAAVIIPPDSFIPGLTDSKALSPKQREMLIGEITQVALDYAVGIVEPGEIDRINIFQATQRAMYEAVSGLTYQYQIVFVDGNSPCRLLNSSQKPIVKGDALSVSVAAASIIAKQTRDALMVDMDVLYPGYGFAEHKGYGTPSHLEALAKLGPSPIHRRSFAPVSALYEREHDQHESISSRASR